MVSTLSRLHCVCVRFPRRCPPLRLPWPPTLQGAFFGALEEAHALLSDSGLLEGLDPNRTYSPAQSDVTAQFPGGLRLQQKRSYYELYQEARDMSAIIVTGCWGGWCCACGAVAHVKPLCRRLAPSQGAAAAEGRLLSVKPANPPMASGRPPAYTSNQPSQPPNPAHLSTRPCRMSCSGRKAHRAWTRPGPAANTMPRTRSIR